MVFQSVLDRAGVTSGGGYILIASLILLTAACAPACVLMATSAIPKDFRFHVANRAVGG